MKYFAIFEKNFERIFQLQWMIGNIRKMILQYSVLCGVAPHKIKKQLSNNKYSY